MCDEILIFWLPSRHQEPKLTTHLQKMEFKVAPAKKLEDTSGSEIKSIFIVSENYYFSFVLFSLPSSCSQETFFLSLGRWLAGLTGIENKRWVGGG